MKLTRLIFFVCLLCASNATNQLCGMQQNDQVPLSANQLFAAQLREEALDKLIHAAAAGDLDSVKFYIKAGAKPNWVSLDTNLTALGTACKGFCQTNDDVKKAETPDGYVTYKLAWHIHKYIRFKEVIGFLAERTGPPDNQDELFYRKAAIAILEKPIIQAQGYKPCCCFFLCHQPNDQLTKLLRSLLPFDQRIKNSHRLKMQDEKKQEEGN
jgi:hypothetical protein